MTDPISAATSATTDLDTPFAALGGEAGVRALADRFYDLMDLEPGYAALRDAHGPSLQDARDKLFWFLCGWLGGPQHYQERFGHPRLRMRHSPFPVDDLAIKHWLDCMKVAMDKVEMDNESRSFLWSYFVHTANFLKNKE